MGGGGGGWGGCTDGPKIMKLERLIATTNTLLENTLPCLGLLTLFPLFKRPYSCTCQLVILNFVPCEYDDQI